MPDIFIALLIGVLTISLCCLIAYEIMRLVWRVVPRLTIAPHLRVVVLIGPVFLIHILNIWLYAGTYFFVENKTGLGTVSGTGRVVGKTYESFLDCLYFSASTYTSLGFGDLVPTDSLRMLAAAEVLNGLVLIAWTASFTYLAMEKFWSLPHLPVRGRRSYD